MATLEEYKTALQFRNLMRSLIKTEMGKSGSDYYYATVYAVDYFNRKCTVTLADGTSQITVNLHSVWPSAVGQVVRISGKQGDQYVAGVLGAVAIPANSYFKSVDDIDAGARIQWDGAGTWGNWIAKVSKDTLTFAYGPTEDTAFTVNKYGIWTPANSGMSTISTDFGTDAGTTTSLTYVKTLTGSGSVVDSTFIAPPSGRVMILFHCRIQNSVAGSASFFSLRVRVNPSGTIIQDYNDDRAVYTTNDRITTGCAVLPVTDLTPGTTYRVEGGFRVTANTGTFDSFRTAVFPSIGA